MAVNEAGLLHGELTYLINGCLMRVHSELGPGEAMIDPYTIPPQNMCLGTPAGEARLRVGANHGPTWAGQVVAERHSQLEP